MKRIYLMLFSMVMGLATAQNPIGEGLSASISLKVPGNAAIAYSLHKSGDRLVAKEAIPVEITQRLSGNTLTVTIKAEGEVYFNFKQRLSTSFEHSACQFYMPGFWYRRNLRSPATAPSFHTSDSWTVREDRLSTPLTVVFNESTGRYLSVMRIDKFEGDALTPLDKGEVVLSGKTSVGYTGFENQEGIAVLSFGFPYQEMPKTYIRKLTLAPAVEAFEHLSKGEQCTLVWQLKSGQAADFSALVKQMWEYSYDTYRPMPVQTDFTDAFVKEVITRYFSQSYVGEHPLKYYASESMRVDVCKSNGSAEVGFIGRTLLNAFNALTYGTEKSNSSLAGHSYAVFDSYLQNGFTPNGFFREFVNFDDATEASTLSIRRQSEGIYAVLHFLQFEKDHARKHPHWEGKLRNILDAFLRLQNADGSFPRKFKDDLNVVDASGGSTPSATLPLVMAYKYFKDKKYLDAAKKSAAYLEKEIISKADYFSSTLDANCEDKEASIYAATATYYLALVSKGKEQQRYKELTRKSAYFALSWYYTWDVPFARGQMIGDIGLKTRGWGNVSVENNHIDVFVFELASVLRWLSKQYNEPRFANFVEVISSSMRQLLPFESHLCGVAKQGYYPEVVQHTHWDYGKNGKGFYNDMFAPGWTVASLWELLSPGRTEQFFNH